MKFRSPWQWLFFPKIIRAIRKILQPWGNLENRFIEALTRNQNQRVIQHLQKSPAEKLLLILPRCLKQTGCKADVQNGLEECLQCRRCPLGQVAILCHKFQITALVAFRSHIAFEMARTRNPDLIIATACHDRLIKALRAVPDVPALLAPLPPMERMCLNSGVNLPWLEEQLILVCQTKLSISTTPDHPPQTASCPGTVFPQAEMAEGP